jgi:hypothetical protein
VSLYRVLFVSTAALLWIASCKTETVGKDSIGPATSSSRRTQVEGADPAPVTLALSLDGMRVSVALPAGWNILPDQSDEGAGLVAFAPRRSIGGGDDQAASAFLDGTRTVRAPASLPEAAAEILRHDQCKDSARCTVLGREMLAGGDYLVSMKTPQSVQVQSWRAGPRGRAVRCGAEVSAPAGPAGTKTWLEDGAAVERARASVEVICRSVTIQP